MYLVIIANILVIRMGNGSLFSNRKCKQESSSVKGNSLVHTEYLLRFHTSLNLLTTRILNWLWTTILDMPSGIVIYSLIQSIRIIHQRRFPYN